MRVGPVLKPLPLHVIDIPSSFNLLLGRPWLHENMTVSSTTLQCEKFPYRVNSGRGASRLSRSRKRQNSANLLRLRSCQVLKASTGKAVQQYNGIQIIRIGSSRKANGTTGEACLAKPSLERLPKAKTPFRVLPVWIDAFPSLQD